MRENTIYAFYIKTNNYAGNYERELTAYLVGHIGDCGVGSEYVEDETTSIFDGAIESIGDEYGCHRPCAICSKNRNNFYIYLTALPTDIQIKTLEDRIQSNNITTVLGYDIVKIETKITIV